MAGKIKFMIDKIITSKAKGNPTIATCTRTKLILKGIAVDKYTENSPDDVTVLNKITKIAQELDVTL
ncbi:MAG: hypothetical protein HFE59_06525 [Clostridiales bacterium]|jgi:hypothetical protein|nr:hypothetical protein [Clostridiales bacterium]